LKRIFLGRAVIGMNMEYSRNVVLEIRDGLIEGIRAGASSCTQCIDRSGFIGIPVLADTHIHVFDSAFLDAGMGLSLREAVAPGSGLKHRLLSRTPAEKLVEASRRTLGYLLSTGVGIVGDFREGGAEGCAMGIEAARGLSIVYVPLCRPRSDLSDLHRLAGMPGGLGLPSPLAYSEQQLRVIREEAARHGKLIHVHVSEDPEDHEAGDYRLATGPLGADVLVHATHMERRELEDAAGRVRGIVACIRSNEWWGLGSPRLADMAELGITVGLGTDNAAWIKPDMWREMEAAFNLLRMQRRGFSDARWILRAATLNGARLLGLEDRGALEEGFRADIVVLDPGVLGLSFSHDPIASIVKRGGPEAVFEVYIDGTPVYSKAEAPGSGLDPSA
jgi:cytosine/adenosine deaminase-related metal-dependent hydrolase